MERRDLIKVVSLGSFAGMLYPNLLKAMNDKPAFSEKKVSDLAGKFYFTKDNPGYWGAKKARGHLPIVERDGDKVKVTTKHKSLDYVHYIVKHVIYTPEWEMIEEFMFTPDKKLRVAESEYTLKDKFKNSEYIIALSYCNKHDGWVDIG